MPVLTTPPDAPPPELEAQLATLRAALDAEVPTKQLDRNLLLATWNLREFGRVTEKWLSEPGDSPRRDVFSIHAIAEIVSRFDVVAIQEVQTRIDALRMLVRVLGPEWGLILTDAVHTDAGDDERLAFVYDVRRAVPSGLACELVVPDEELRAGVPGDLTQQFARTPYAVAFRSERTTFILVTLHILYGKDAADRIPELRAIARWMRRWADDTADAYHQNLLCLGDFNIEKPGDPAYDAFIGQGLFTPPELRDLPRTLPSRRGPKFYDQIAWFAEGGDAKLTLRYTGRARTFEWDKHVLTGLDRVDASYRISDHYPLWCEFLLP